MPTNPKRNDDARRLTVAKRQIATLETELEKAKRQNAALKAERAKARAEIAKAKADADSAWACVTEAEEAILRADILERVGAPH